MKYILVTGGVISGVGKGIVSSCIGTVLRSRGWRVTCIKIDPYLNIDAGTFSPYEHGEVYVLDDGSEVDLDLGNYERFLDITLKCHHNITTGRVYKSVIEKERRGDFLGKTVQVVPHVTEAIQDWVSKVAKLPVDGSDLEPEICIMELGGTIGEIESMPFVESFRQMLMKYGPENFCCIHVSLIPTVGSVGEPKTKPTQMSVWELRNKGLKADILICRSSQVLPDSCIEKLSQMCFVDRKYVFSLPDVSNIYLIPGMMENRKLTDYILQNLKLPLNRNEFDINSTFPCILDRWNEMIAKADKAANGTVRISLVGKYTKLRDSYISILKALQHSTADAQCILDLELIDSAEFEGFDDFGVAEAGKVAPDPEKERQAWIKILNSDGVIIPGGFGERGITGKLNVIRFCREHGIPTLGICLGYQCMTIEFARNILKLPESNSTEFDKYCKDPVVIEMPEHNPGQLGGTMRLGMHASKMELSKTASDYLNKSDQAQSTILSILNTEKFHARHRHRYEVNPEYVERFEKEGLLFVGRDLESGRRMEIAELVRHSPSSEETYVPEMIRNSEEFKAYKNRANKRNPYYVGVQFHPEYTSRPTRPSPIFLGLIYASIGKMDELLKIIKEENIVYNGLFY